MTKRDYVTMAAIVRAEVEKANKLPPVSRAIVNLTLLNVAEEMANVFAADNPRFDRLRFLDAAGFGE